MQKAANGALKVLRQGAGLQAAKCISAGWGFAFGSALTDVGARATAPAPAVTSSVQSAVHSGLTLEAAQPVAQQSLQQTAQELLDCIDVGRAGVMFLVGLGVAGPAGLLVLRGLDMLAGPGGLAWKVAVEQVSNEAIHPYPSMHSQLPPTSHTSTAFHALAWRWLLTHSLHPLMQSTVSTSF